MKGFKELKGGCAIFFFNFSDINKNVSHLKIQSKWD